MVCYCTVSGIDSTPMMIWQWGWTALIKASEAGQVECVKVLLDRGSKVNMQQKVSGVIIHCVPAMKHPESPVVNHNVYKGTLFSACT